MDLREVSLGRVDDLVAGLGGVLLEYCSQHSGWIVWMIDSLFNYICGFLNL
jgi:hypothetical protein